MKKLKFKGTQGVWSLSEKDQPKLRVVSLDVDEDVCECLSSIDAKLISKSVDFFDELNLILESGYLPEDWNKEIRILLKSSL